MQNSAPATRAATTTVTAATLVRCIVFSTSGADYDTWAVLGGVYYDPVPQLTLGLEAEWYTTETNWNITVPRRARTMVLELGINERS